MFCTFEASYPKARPNVQPCCFQLKFSNVLQEATVQSSFYEKKTLATVLLVACLTNWYLLWCQKNHPGHFYVHIS
jgi:hypothetical protein